MESSDNKRIMCFATQGSGHLEAERVRFLLEPFQPEVYPFDYDRKIRSAIGLVRAALRRRPSLIVMEGTGMAGGVTLLALDAFLRIPFAVSGGDAVGPYLRLRSRVAGLIGGLYERLLCRRCAGYVGWTPYLVGRALTFGARRGMTAPGWAPGNPSSTARQAIRQRLGVAADAIIIGLTGTLNWRKSVGYVYGAELVQAVRRVRRDDVVVCIVGDGAGRERLEAMAEGYLGSRVLLPGRVPREEVADYLAAFDVASLPQSVDKVGSFRYTTKLSEYFGAGLPVITGQIPAAYDLDLGCFLRLPGDTPWSPTYIGALVQLLDGLNPADLAERRQAILQRPPDPFDLATQQQRMSEFLQDILSSS